MSFREFHKKRADGIQHFISSNKLFVVIALVAAVIIGSGLIKEKKVVDTLPDTEQTAEATRPQWRFYPSDVAILVVGGGFCTMMIIRERKKAKEELD